MGDLDAAIGRYIDDEIALSAKDISGSAASREWFLTRLRNEIEEQDWGPQLLAGDAGFVNFGSYFKGTKVSDVDEVDVLVVLDSNSGFFSRAGRALGQGVGTADPNHKYDARFLKADGSGVSPIKILEWLHSIVADVVESFEGETPRIDGPAVTARIVSKDLAIDLVPAGVFTRDSDDSTFYNIAKDGSSNGWTLTSPRMDIDDLVEAAESRPNLKNVIRLLKQVKDRYALGISSFALERQVVRYARRTHWTKYLSIELPYAMRDVADAVENGTIPDLFDPSTNLLDGAEDRDGTALIYRDIAQRLDELLADQVNQDDDDLYDAVHDLFENG